MLFQTNKNKQTNQRQKDTIQKGKPNVKQRNKQTNSKMKNGDKHIQRFIVFKKKINFDDKTFFQNKTTKQNSNLNVIRLFVFLFNKGKMLPVFNS